MRHRKRSSRNRSSVRPVLALAAGAVLLAAAPAPGQEPAYTAPRTADGTPDLNGIWQALGNAHWDIEPHAAGPSVVRALGALAAVPGGLGVVEGGVIPYRPEALAQRDDNAAHLLERDPAIKCYLPGVPRATYMPFPFQIIQSRSHVMILHESPARSGRSTWRTRWTHRPTVGWAGRTAAGKARRWWSRPPASTA